MYRSRLVGNFIGVLIFVTFMIDLIGSHEKFPTMKINASTAKVIQTLRLQSLASHDIVKKMIILL